MRFKKIGKCPNCCPDGGACFNYQWSEEGPLWCCNNCFHKIPFRQLPRLTEPTPKQQATIDFVLSVFGGSVTKLGFINRECWFVIDNPDRRWYEGNLVFGTVHANGKFSVRYYPLFQSEARVLRDRSAIKIYLAWNRPAAAPVGGP